MECHALLEEDRQSADYKPNIWNFDFLQSLTSQFNERESESRVEKLKEEVKEWFAEEVEKVKKMEVIDKMRKLGVSNLFEKEIQEALELITESINNTKLIVDDDLYATALYFKLMRQYGYQVSQEIFGGFVDEKGSFSTSKCVRIEGVIELYQASHLGFENEQLLIAAQRFSTNFLHEIIHDSPLDNDINLTKTLSHVLELCDHWRVQWFDVRWQIDLCPNDNTSLLELAKLHFNLVQAKLQDDLIDISRWWRNLGVIDNFKFMRDRLVESFMCSIGLVFEPKHSKFRKWITKVVVFILIIDDIYDNFGSLEELQHFTNAVSRWDPKEVQDLPMCMRLGFQALHNTTIQMASEIESENGWIGVLPYLQIVWADFCKALYVEANWYNKGYTPTLKEYLNNAWISSGGTVLTVHSIFSILINTPTEEMMIIQNILNKFQDLVYNSSIIIRICNDLGTSTAELERGDVASSILCYMQEVNVPEDVARDHIKTMISEAWKNINRQCLKTSPFLQPFVNVATNFARVAHSLYQHGDGFGVQDLDTKKIILSLLVQAI